jgi:hypothetical protein
MPSVCILVVSWIFIIFATVGILYVIIVIILMKLLAKYVANIYAFQFSPLSLPCCNQTFLPFLCLDLLLFPKHGQSAHGENCVICPSYFKSFYLPQNYFVCTSLWFLTSSTNQFSLWSLASACVPANWCVDSPSICKSKFPP